MELTLEPGEVDQGEGPWLRRPPNEPPRRAIEPPGSLDRLRSERSWPVELDRKGTSELRGRDSRRAAPGQGLRLEVKHQPVVEVRLGVSAVSLDLAEEVD